MYYLKPTDPHPITPTKAVLLGLLCIIWISTGLIGHDPWKPDEAYSFGLIYSILQEGRWLAPTLAGEPFLDKPPLFYWSAALLAKLFQSWLPLHDGARLASGFYTTLTLLFIGLTARRLYGDNRGWAAAIILIGCVGMLTRSHQIIADLVLLSGCAMMLYGFSRSLAHPKHAGMLLGTGAGIGFMSNGFIALSFFSFTASALPLLYRNWRQANYLQSMSISILFIFPWLAIWPFLLYRHSPQLFTEWIWTHNTGSWIHYLGNSFWSNALYYLESLPLLSWPAIPLAIWVVWKSRKRITQRDDLQLPLVNFLAMFVSLSFSATSGDVPALPMLLPLTLLATASLATLKRGAASALDWFGIMAFAFIAILMWWGWAGLLLENRYAWVPRQFREFQPDFHMELHVLPFAIAIVATLIWMLIVWRTGRSMRRAVLNWASGVTLVWVLAMTLWLPWLDSSKSYRNMVSSLKKSIPPHYLCIGRENIGNDQRAMLHYIGDIVTRIDASNRCDLRLAHEGKSDKPLLNDHAWKVIWEGKRKGTRLEYYRLYQRLDDRRNT